MTSIALVGAGYIGRLHADVIHASFPDARILKVHDPVQKKSRELAERVGAAHCGTPRDILDDPGIDVIVVCTPTHLHAEMVIQAAEHGKDIFCEKPLAMSLSEADQMIRVTEARGVRAFCGHVLRFWPVYVKARQVLQGGSLGKPLFAYCERLLTMPTYTEKAWNRAEKLSGGVALDVQIHDLDFVSWVMGEPEVIRSIGLRDDAQGGWAHIATQIEFGGGGRAVVQAGWTYPGTFPFTMAFRILCEKGALEWSFRAGQLLEQRDVESPLILYGKHGQPQAVPVDGTDAFLHEWKYFLGCIRDGAPIRESTFHDGRNALAMALATRESAASGSPVRLRAT
jgi:predicted dehydrogenase